MADRRSLASGAAHIREEERGLPPLVDVCDQGASSPVWRLTGRRSGSVRRAAGRYGCARTRAQRAPYPTKGRSRCSVALTDRRGCLLRLRVTGGPAMTALRPRPEAVGRRPVCARAGLCGLRLSRVAGAAGHQGGIPARVRRTQPQPRASARGRGWPKRGRRVATRSDQYACCLRVFRTGPRPGSGCVQTSTMLWAVPDGDARLRDPETPRALAFRMPC